MRTLFLFLSWISHAVAEFSELPHTPTQEGAAALPTSLLPADTSAELYSSPLEPSPWTAAESSNNEPRCQQQASTSLSESTKSAIFSSNSIANCADHSPDQIQNPSKVKRSQLSKHPKKDSCPDQRALPPSGSDERGRPWPSFGDGVDIEKRILQLMLTQGVDGVADPTACWQDEYMQIPVCTPLRGFRQSPAQVVEPCRLSQGVEEEWNAGLANGRHQIMSGRIYDMCDMLEDMWCCSIAKEQIRDEPGLYLPNPAVSNIWWQQWKYKEGPGRISISPKGPS